MNWYRRSTRSGKSGELCLNQLSESTRKKTIRKKPLLQNYIKSKKSNIKNKKRVAKKTVEESEGTQDATNTHMNDWL